MTNSKRIFTISALTLSTVLVGIGALHAQSKNKYDSRVPGGLALAEVQGFESWETVSISQNGPLMAVILGNPKMIEAYEAGSPGNGRAFPDGAKMVKIHWKPKRSDAPGNPAVPGTLANVDVMVKDSTRFADSGGWGYGAFEYEPTTDSFRPGTATDNPPQSDDAKCGFACHSLAKSRDYVFTEFARR